MNNNTAQKWLLHEPVHTEFARIIPALAMEIGLNESIILVHISYWLSISNNVKDGRYWTYQTLRDMQEKVFPYWSVETIRRTIQSLQTQGYINIGNFNSRKGDRTQWFALEPNKCSELKSVIVLPVDGQKLVSKRDSLSQNETPTPQNETTLPEITTEITTKESIASNDAKVSVASKDMNPMKDAIALAFRYDWKTMTGTEKGCVQKAARELCLANVTADDIPALYAYCAANFKNFKAMALPGNLSAWRKTLPSPLNIVTTLDLSKWTSEPLAHLEGEQI